MPNCGASVLHQHHHNAGWHLAGSSTGQALGPPNVLYGMFVIPTAGGGLAVGALDWALKSQMFKYLILRTGVLHIMNLLFTTMNPGKGKHT